MVQMSLGPNIRHFCAPAPKKPEAVYPPISEKLRKAPGPELSVLGVQPLRGKFTYARVVSSSPDKSKWTVTHADNLFIEVEKPMLHISKLCGKTMGALLQLPPSDCYVINSAWVKSSSRPGKRELYIMNQEASIRGFIASHLNGVESEYGLHFIEDSYVKRIMKRTSDVKAMEKKCHDMLTGPHKMRNVPKFFCDKKLVEAYRSHTVDTKDDLVLSLFTTMAFATHLMRDVRRHLVATPTDSAPSAAQL